MLRHCSHSGSQREELLSLPWIKQYNSHVRKPTLNSVSVLRSDASYRVIICNVRRHITGASSALFEGGGQRLPCPSLYCVWWDVKPCSISTQSPSLPSCPSCPFPFPSPKIFTFPFFPLRSHLLFPSPWNLHRGSRECCELPSRVRSEIPDAKAIMNPGNVSSVNDCASFRVVKMSTWAKQAKRRRQWREHEVWQSFSSDVWERHGPSAPSPGSASAIDIILLHFRSTRSHRVQ